jgi:hypothetical protein
VYYFLAHPAIIKFRELRAGKAKPQQPKPVETPKQCQTETAPEIEQKIPENSHLEIDHKCHAVNRQNVGNVSDYTLDRLNINTPPLPHYSESL